MTALDDLLKQNKTWLEQALKRPLFDKVDKKATDFPEEQRQRLIAESKKRIEGLIERKKAKEAFFDQAIASEKAELDRLSAQKPPTAPTDSVKPKRDNSHRPKGKRS